MPREVVVTGLGMISAAGKSVEDSWDNIVAGRSGIVTLSRFDTSAYDQAIAGEVQDFNPTEHVDPKLLRRIDLSTAFAIAASLQAISEAAIVIPAEHPSAVGIILGTGIGGAHLMIEQQRVLEEKGPRRISPFLMSNFLPDTATGLVLSLIHI